MDGSLSNDFVEIFEMLRAQLDEELLDLVRSAELFQSEFARTGAAHKGRLQQRRDEVFTSIEACVKARERLATIRKTGEIDEKLREDLRRYRKQNGGLGT